MSSKKSNSSVKKAEIDTEKAAAIKSTAKGITVESALKSVTDLQLNINKSLSEVTSQLTQKVTELDTVNKAIELQNEELTRLFGVGAALKDIDELEVQHQARKQELDQELESYQRNIDGQKADADFQFEQQQKLAQQQFEDANRQRQIENDNKQRALELGWKEREEGLKKQEVEVSELRKQVAEFPQKLSNEVSKAVAIAENSVKRDLGHKLDLVQKDAEAAARIAANTIQANELTIKALNEQVAKLQARIEASESKVSEIATKALESASGQQSLAAVTSFAAVNKENGKVGKQ